MLSTNSELISEFCKYELLNSLNKHRACSEDCKPKNIEEVIFLDAYFKGSDLCFSATKASIDYCGNLEFFLDDFFILGDKDLEFKSIDPVGYISDKNHFLLQDLIKNNTVIIAKSAQKTRSLFEKKFPKAGYLRWGCLTYDIFGRKKLDPWGDDFVFSDGKNIESNISIDSLSLLRSRSMFLYFSDNMRDLIDILNLSSVDYKLIIADKLDVANSDLFLSKGYSFSQLNDVYWKEVPSVSIDSEIKCIIQFIPEEKISVESISCRERFIYCM